MKTFFVILFAVASGAAIAQKPYTSTVDDKNVTILNGIITESDLSQNPAFGSWYGANQIAYRPADAVLTAMKAAAANTQFVIFGGTWCEDTQFIIPRFFRLMAMSGIADSSISFFAVDRNKKTQGNIAAAFHITNVPTIIVMQNGKETGRVVEYGKTGKWDEELAAIVGK